MSHILKLFYRVLNSRLKQVIHIRRQKLGFMKMLGTVDGIFSFQQNMEKQKVLHIVLIDLEKAYDRVPRLEVW